MIRTKSTHDTRNMKAILVVTIIMIGAIGVSIKIPIVVLLWFCGIVAVSPWIIILLKEDLTNGLLIWILLVLFSVAIGKITLPMLPDISLYRIMWILLVLAFLVQIAFREIDFLPITKIEIMMILFCIICLISMIKAGTIFTREREQGLVLHSFLNGYAIPFSIFLFAKHIVNNTQRIKKLFQFLLIIGIYLALTGIFEHFRITTLVFPRYIMNPNAGIHWGRARGPFVQAAVNGTVLGMILVLSIYLVLYKQRKLSRFFYGIPIVLMPITIFFTYTRACWLGLILSILLIPLFYPRVRKFFLLGLFLIVTIAIFNWSNVMSEDRTVGGISAMNPVYARANLFGVSLRMFLDRPIFGFGYKTFNRVSPEYFYEISGIPLRGRGVASHNTLLTTLVELGIVGFIPLLLIFFYIFRHSIRLYHRLPSNPFLGKGLVAIFWGMSIVFMINIQFIEMRFFLIPNSLFFLLAGIIVGLNQRTLLRKACNDQENKSLKK